VQLKLQDGTCLDIVMNVIVMKNIRVFNPLASSNSTGTTLPATKRAYESRIHEVEHISVLLLMSGGMAMGHEANVFYKQLARLLVVERSQMQIVFCFNFNYARLKNECDAYQVSYTFNKVLNVCTFEQ